MFLHRNVTSPHKPRSIVTGQQVGSPHTIKGSHVDIKERDKILWEEQLLHLGD